jgi:hypothetical protein
MIFKEEQHVVCLEGAYNTDLILRGLVKNLMISGAWDRNRTGTATRTEGF